MRGYFGIGVEGISKAMNVGSIMRTAHAFGASFVFTIDAQYERTEGEKSDTSAAPDHLPLHEFENLDEFRLPKDCRLVGVELADDADILPSFQHPRQCAYVLGPERGSLSADLSQHCDYIVQIPTKFCVNVGIAAAIVMYDRTLSLGRYAPRPARIGGPVETLDAHVFGDPVLRRRRLTR